jgi:hypothetical protein
MWGLNIRRSTSYVVLWGCHVVGNFFLARISCKNKSLVIYVQHIYACADLSGRAAWGVSLGVPPLACWDCGFESRLGHECVSLLSVACCQVDVTATSRSLLQRSPAECGVSVCDLETSTIRWPRPYMWCCTKKISAYSAILRKSNLKTATSDCVSD